MGPIVLRAVLSLTFLLGTSCSGGLVFAQSEADPPTFAHFRPLWDHLRSDIQSAEVHFRVYYSVKPAGPCDDQRLHELIDQYELANSASRVEEFLKEFSGAAKLTAPDRVHRQNGDRTRQEFGQSIYIEDSDYFMIRKDANRQIAAYYRGGSTIGIPRLEHIRRLPNTDYEPQRITRTGVTATLSSQSVLNVRGQEFPVEAEYECDWDSGIPIRFRRRVDGRLLSETHLFNLTEYTGNVTFPECAMKVNYVPGQVTPQVQQLTLYVVDEARFNVGVPDNLFVMSKPVGMTVLDYRFPGSAQDLGVTQQEVADIRKVLPATSRAMSAFVAPEWSMRRRLFFLANGILMIGLSIWLWRRAIRTS
jgi:hypothetical protein